MQSTVSGGGKKHLVANLRHVNRYLKLHKFKYEELCMAIATGVWMFSFDLNYIFSLSCNLKSGYHHVDIMEHHQNFVGFK